jgi:CheY-like chemotaxis protein
MARPTDGATVLVIDDEPDIRDAAVMLLRSDGYAAVSAENGREALGLLRSGAVRPRLIILDLAMPVMDGFASRTAQLSDPRLAPIPVVVLSAAGPVVPKAVERMHAAATVEKPVDGDELLRVVEAYRRPALDQRG